MFKYAHFRFHRNACRHLDGRTKDFDVGGSLAQCRQHGNLCNNGRYSLLGDSDS